ncbi:MAG: TetR/AcrR family transcriptional regulator, partial [Deltaproteobacteria bacterium]|nr:TetR/AcrR family transcriptional regulator [Deltaproteobacteria bacterium]
MTSDELQPLAQQPPRRAERLSAADRRAQILREAMGCFAELGFRGTTTRILAERIGISEAALYRYFPSKESLYAAIIDQKMTSQDLPELLRPAAERRDDAAVFGGLARGIFSRVDGDSDFLRILMFTALEGHALSEPFFETRVRKLRKFITDYVAQRIEDGAFRAVDSGLAVSRALPKDVSHVEMIEDHAEKRAA